LLPTIEPALESKENIPPRRKVKKAAEMKNNIFASPSKEKSTGGLGRTRQNSMSSPAKKSSFHDFDGSETPRHSTRAGDDAIPVGFSLSPINLYSPGKTPATRLQRKEAKRLLVDEVDDVEGDDDYF
jgi:hypothetical protein